MIDQECIKQGLYSGPTYANHAILHQMNGEFEGRLLLLGFYLFILK